MSRASVGAWYLHKWSVRAVISAADLDSWVFNPASCALYLPLPSSQPLLISALPVAQPPNLKAFFKNMFLNFIYLLTTSLGMREGS